MANARNSIVLPQIGYFINSVFQVIEASGLLSRCSSRRDQHDGRPCLQSTAQRI
jgi:hypothetical protein